MDFGRWLVRLRVNENIDKRAKITSNIFAGNSSKKTKINLLASFLTLLHFCIDEDEPEVVYWLDEIKMDANDADTKLANLASFFRSKLMSGDYSDYLLKIFCEDAAAASDIWKVGDIRLY